MNIEEQLKILEQTIATKSLSAPRTVEEFVDDMICRGRDLKQILVVTFCTRWKGQEQKIKETYHERTSRKDEKVSS